LSSLAARFFGFALALVALFPLPVAAKADPFGDGVVGSATD